MLLVPEVGSPIQNPTEADIRSMLASQERFGAYLRLERDAASFVQAALAEWLARESEDTSVWEKSYLEKTGDSTLDPAPSWYVIECREAGQHEQCENVLSKDELANALVEYLRGGSNWKNRLTWQ